MPGDMDGAAVVQARPFEAADRIIFLEGGGIVATFNAIDRVADATGIPIDQVRLGPTADLREQLGIDAFPSRAGV